MAAVHLIVGYMGFGKTFFARRLERELPAVRFTHDGFMHALYGRNLPEEEFRDAWQRVDALIWKLAEQTVKAGAHAILDYGFWSREARRRAYERARKLTEDVVSISCAATGKQRWPGCLRAMPKTMIRF